MVSSDKTVQVMLAREHLAAALAELKELEEMNDGRLTGRYAALGRTAIEEAENWLRQSIEEREGES